jgi:hypothetical protein
MIDLAMVQADVKAIINQDFCISMKVLKDGSVRKCHFNQNSKVIFDDGAVGTEITALMTVQNNEDMRLKDEVEILGEKYEITKIILESQILKRLFLREL